MITSAEAELEILEWLRDIVGEDSSASARHVKRFNRDGTERSPIERRTVCIALDDMHDELTARCKNG